MKIRKEKIEVKSTDSTLRSNYIYNFISQIITLIIPLITAPYLARIFREEGSGQIAFANNIITYFTMFANLGFLTYGQREIAKSKCNTYEKSKTFWEISILHGLFSLASFTILLCATFGGIFGRQYTQLILIFGIQVIASAIDINFYYQGIEDFKIIAIRSIIIRVLCLIFIFVFVKKASDIWIYALIYSGSVLIANSSLWVKLRKNLVPVKFRDFDLKKHILPSLIIFLPTLATTIYGSLDKLMIGYLCINPDYENGCYNQALKLNQVILIIITVIDSVMVARNSRDYALGNYNFIKKHIGFATNYVMIFGIPLMVGVCLLSTNLSSWYLGEGYKEVPLLLNIMSVRFIVSGLACVYGNQLFIAIGKEKYTTIAHLCTCIFNLILNFIYIPWLGAIGAAITTALAETLDFFVLFVIAIKNKYTSVSYLITISIKPVISAIIMAIPVYFINKVMGNDIVSFAVSVLVGVLIYAIMLIILKDKFTQYCIENYLKKRIKCRKAK